MRKECALAVRTGNQLCLKVLPTRVATFAFYCRYFLIIIICIILWRQDRRLRRRGIVRRVLVDQIPEKVVGRRRVGARQPRRRGLERGIS